MLSLLEMPGEPAYPQSHKGRRFAGFFRRIRTEVMTRARPSPNWMLLCVCMHVCLCVHAHVPLHTHTHTHTRIFMCMYVHVFVRLCECTCAHVSCMCRLCTCLSLLCKCAYFPTYVHMCARVWCVHMDLCVFCLFPASFPSGTKAQDVRLWLLG